MRNHAFAAGASCFRERREIGFAVEVLPAIPPDPQKVETQINEDTRYLDTSFKDILAEVEKDNGVKLSADRMEGIERQRQMIRQKLSAIKGMKFDYEQEFNFQRDKLVNQVWDLVSYAKFQAQQQKELEKGSAEPLDVERDEKDGIIRFWIPDDGKSSIELAFAQNNPQVAKLVGTIKYEQNVVSSRMPGTFSLVRMESGGKKYWVVSVEPNFNGTFTFLSGGKRKTMDAASIGEQRNFQKTQREGKILDEQQAKLELIRQEVAADTLSPEVRYLVYELQALIAEVEADRAKLLGKPGIPAPDANADALAATRAVRIAELHKKFDTIKKNRDRWTEQGFSRPDMLSQMPAERERNIYQLVRQADNGFPTWVEAADLNKLAQEMGLNMVPPPKNGMEDYMIDANGNLLMRTRRRGRVEVKGGPVVPGRVVAQFAYKDGQWSEAKILARNK